MEATAIQKSLKQDLFEGVDFLDLDDLLTEEQKLIRSISAYLIA
jgi:glutaryl-CoA dehydrogenase